MNKELKKRFEDVRKYLEEEFKHKEPRSWWRQQVNNFTLTRDMADGKRYFPQNREETIVKFDFIRALTSSALFFTINFLMFFFIGGNENAFTPTFLLMNIVLFVALFFPLLKGDKRGSLMVFNKEGFLVSKMPTPIKWEHLVASYIRADHSGEDPSYYLLLYYYDETKDEFEETEYNIYGLDMNKEDIAAQIEYWKMISGTNAVNV